MEKYDPRKIEPKWQEKWAKSGIYKNYGRDKKFYALDMFPYPSGAGLHVGHPKGYIATDVVSRYKLLQGCSVLHPMGWDAFGLPAENYAIANKIHPKVAVEKNIATFKKQLGLFGFTYDWGREINTTDPEYYRWTQWIFLKMFEKGLAYEAEVPVNWCPSCKTVLANEDLEDGKCERCGTQVIQKKMRQWVLKMTDYADRLLFDLDDEDLDWEDSIVEQQKNWIGRSEGAQFGMKVEGAEEKIEVYTTRLDTVFGMTYAVVAPEHAIIEKLKDRIENYQEVEKYIIQSQNKTVLERTELQKEKTGVELQGIKVINPFTDEKLPLYVADYVLGFYGTGAVMAVPAHDDRDFEFAKKYKLPVKQTIAPFFEGIGKDAPIKEEMRNERKVIISIVKHWEKEEYICLNWEKFGWKSFVIGGVEEGEKEEDAAVREMREETGYQNVKEVRRIGWETHNNFNARHKKIGNRYVKATCYLIELADGEHREPEEEHTKNHKGVWVKKGEIKNFLNLPQHSSYWETVLKGESAYTDDGVLINAGRYSGVISSMARVEFTERMEKSKTGKVKVNYKMRDWVFSRQRYWGEPIPIIHCEKCGTVGVPEEQLPIRLPEVESYEPTGTGEGPLAKITAWVNVACPKCGGPGKRETNTMPQWAGSSWYFLRYIDTQNSQDLVDKKLEKRWMPVDLYVGGAEHATRHLLYARFWHKFLYDIGVVSAKEPFKKLVHVGLILAEDGRKMSKRWNNVINPDDVIDKFGADSIRLYEMFMGPFTQSVAWSTDGIKGARKFLEKAWDYLESWKQDYKNDVEANKINIELYKKSGDDGPDFRISSKLHKTIKKVTEDIENFRFNTAISQLMIFTNYIREEKKTGESSSSITEINLAIPQLEKFLIILSPFAPHIAEELWEKLGHKESIFLEKWPDYDPELIKDEEIELVVQVSGKLRDRLKVSADISEKEAKKMALEREKIKSFVGAKEIRKIIFVKGKLINIVV